MLHIRHVTHRIILLLLVFPLLFLGTFACSSPVAAFSPLTVLSIVGGNVHVLKTGTSNWANAKEGITLQAGDEVKTESDSKASITFFDGSTIDLSGDTQISLNTLLSKSSTSPKTIKIGQTIGETTSNVVNLVDPASRYEVDTASGVAAVRGSKMVVQVTASGITKVYNLEGVISLTAQGKEVTIPMGSSSSASPGQAPTAPQPGIPPGIGNSNAISISARAGWQQTGLQLNAGDKFNVDYRGGSWTVDYRSFPYVGLAGYSADIDQTIAAGYKFDSSLPYGYLLGKVGNGKEIPIGNQSGPFTADFSGFVSMRINDSDSALGDNDGAITVTLRSTTPQPSTSSNNLVALSVPVSGSGGFNYTQGTYLEGFEFKTNSSISITQLGAYDSNYSSLPNGTETFTPTEVALYDLTTHTLLGSVTVKASDPVTGVYHYTSLTTPVVLNTTNNYAVVWVSGTNHYIAGPTLTLEDVNSAITYVGFVGYGPGGLTQTSKMVEPDWFYSESNNGIGALNYDLGPNFTFVKN